MGKKAANGAWLIAQHADHDIRFQKTCLKLLQVATVNPQNIAYLTDRVLVNQQKPQMNGTQFHLNSLGKLAPWPIQDSKNLSKRRRAMNLKSFKSYWTEFKTKQKTLQKEKRR